MTPEQTGPASGGSDIDLLAHEVGDHVAVAVRDIQPGAVQVAWLTSPQRQSFTASAAIPFGHKMAIVDLPEGEQVLEYGSRIGITTKPVHSGELVHTHNIRSARWQSN